MYLCVYTFVYLLICFSVCIMQEIYTLTCTHIKIHMHTFMYMLYTHASACVCMLVVVVAVVVVVVAVVVVTVFGVAVVAELAVIVVAGLITTTMFPIVFAPSWVSVLFFLANIRPVILSLSWGKYSVIIMMMVITICYY